LQRRRGRGAHMRIVSAAVLVSATVLVASPSDATAGAIRGSTAHRQVKRAQLGWVKGEHTQPVYLQDAGVAITHQSQGFREAWVAWAQERPGSQPLRAFSEVRLGRPSHEIARYTWRGPTIEEGVEGEDLMNRHTVRSLSRGWVRITSDNR